MSADAEAAEKYRQNLARIQRELTGYLKNIGDPTKDSANLRSRIEASRSRWQQEEQKLVQLLKVAPQDDRVWQDLKAQHGLEKSNFDTLNAQLRKRENENPLAGSSSAAAMAASQQDISNTRNSGAGGGPPKAGATVKAQAQLTRLALAEHLTEEQIQREKLQGAVEIEQDVAELKSIYTDFNSMLQEQQVGLNVTEKNVDQATKHVEKGVVELKSASSYQKSSRKKLCILIAILVVIIAIVVIVVVVLKK